MNMNLDYVLLNPTGNMTILVETPVPAASQPFCAAALLAAEPTAEQVGFLSPGRTVCDIALRMAGGEFCGNAAMSAAALFCEKTGRRGIVRVRVSGVVDPVEVEVTPAPDGGFACTVEMPPVLGIETVSLRFGGRELRLPLVRCEGISHLIVTQPMERDFAEGAIKCWCAELGADGLGLLLLDEAAKALTPLVYVPCGDTLYWEHSCASGTAAVGAYLAETALKSVSALFAEPGGSLGVTALPGGRTSLRGSVRITRQGSISLDLDAAP